MSNNVTMKDMLEAGVHYGHQTRRWNPKMDPFIFGSRNGIHIIDLQKTVKSFKKACSFLENTTAKGGHVLFVGTKRIARDIIKEAADSCNMYYINQRWLGGTLTNYQTIRQSIHRLKRLKKMEKDGTFAQLTKKEALNLTREREKLEDNIGGIENMPGLPSAIFIVDSHKEGIAVMEGRKLRIPIVAITDTNADPTMVDYPVPGNDDSLKSLLLFVKAAADACNRGVGMRKDFSKKEDKLSDINEGTFRDQTGHAVAVEKAKAPKE